ncbi:MAG: hypothetical protein SOV74_07570 [Coriobacteriales bacterium]|nr:hypothetical protein [Coriobacteriales bacterium]
MKKNDIHIEFDQDGIEQIKHEVMKKVATDGTYFTCPQCGSEFFARGETFSCPSCGTEFKLSC